MSIFEGVSECWWLSSRCTLNWDAVSAVGTIGAVAVALFLAIAEFERSSKERRYRARWIALEVRAVLAEWYRSIESAGSMQDADLYFSLISEDSRNPISIPQGISELRFSLHELGNGMAPLADAIWLARQLSGCPVTSALRGELEDANVSEAIVREFRQGLGTLEMHVREAHRRVSNIAGPKGSRDAARLFGC